MVQNEKGVTLLEVLLSITILSIILLSIMNVFPQMGMMNEHNEAKSQGVNEAKRVLVNWKASEEVVDFLQDPAPANRPMGYKREDTTYYYFQTLEQPFDVYIKIKKNTDLHSAPSKAHLVEIKLLKDHRTVSETYGYITIGE
ncbi:type II secretion system protein J [Bacillus sp. AFS015802]|uniref:PulJ/GspJ family protein n=1 Tax=Bacillus sp. AFS015802 TaxID=2033486 RepID=UPI0015CF2AB9|nr:prepilin-type N-terminal cleavage/methylation domain-containing protein [Bacillus sp. AFS015802]